MIDEDLYQQAADELNTDKRRPHIWARACALASDDHDEARYLYTNLRVEELLAERADADASSAAANVLEHEPDDGSLALEPLDFDEDSPQSISTPSGLDQNERPEVDVLSLDSADADELPVFEAAQSRNFEQGFDAKPGSGDEQALDDQELDDDFLDETINLTSELDGTAVFELDNADADDSLSDAVADRKLTELSADEELEALLGGVYEAGASVSANTGDSEAVMTADFSDVSGAHDDLAWLDEDPRTAADGQKATDGKTRSVSDDQDDALTLEDFQDTDRVASELERQADEQPGQSAEVVSISKQPDAEGHDATDEEQLALILDDESSGAGRNDASNTTRLDSMFDSIEDEAASRQTKGTDTPDPDTTAASQAPSNGELETGAVYADVDKYGNSSEDKNTQPAAHTDRQLPAAAMSATAGTVAVKAPGTSAPSSASKTPANDTAFSRPAELPLDLTAERSSGSRYSVFRRDSQTQAVRRGVSWSALFLTLPFLIYRHLFGTAVVYSITWLILMGGLLISGMAWLDAGPVASLAIKASTVGFAVLAFFGLLYLPFRHANQWREDKLGQRGFEQVALVRDTSPGKAIAQARNAATLD